MRKQKKIKNILMKKCPSFVFYDSPGGAFWHKCHCIDLTLPKVLRGDWPEGNVPYDKEDYAHCDCVHLLKDECHRGKWSCLDFLN